MLRAEISAQLKRAIRLHETGNITQAEELYREILSIDRNVPDAWNMLAVALCQQRRLDEAAQAAQRAVGLRPNIAPYWLTQGNIAVERGRMNEAQSNFRRAIKLNPEFTEAHYWLARSYQRDGRLPQAIDSYRSALAAGSENPEIYYHLARALLLSDRAQEALVYFEQAFVRDRDGIFDRRECLDQFRYLTLSEPSDFWHAELIRFLDRNDIDKSRYGIAGQRVLMVRPAFRAIHAAAAQETFEPARDHLKGVVDDELFGILLRDTIIAQPEFEFLLTRLRAGLLMNAELRGRVPLKFICDLALQCFNNEFVFFETHAETEQIRDLLQGIETDLRAASTFDETSTQRIATLAMYRPLSEIGGIERFATVGHVAVQALLQRTVVDPKQEQLIRAAIPVEGVIEDDVSRAVRAQYENNPYPRWLSFDHTPPIPAAEWLHREVPNFKPIHEVGSSIRLLVAGCGTGVETLALATQIKASEVTGIDLSLSSLAYAQRMANKMGIRNVEFRQADILNLPQFASEQTPSVKEPVLGINSFDVIYCVGVLMAMREPAAGLRALLPLLRTGGLLKIGVYSRRARVAVNQAREIIRDQPLPATAAAIREFRRTIFCADDDSPLKSLLGWRDFYSMSDCRDFLFHVQEHQFELSEIAEVLGENGLRILGMSKQLPRAAIINFRKVFPRERLTTDLDKWEKVEQRHPDTFLGMYQIWSEKV